MSTTSNFGFLLASIHYKDRGVISDGSTSKELHIETVIVMLKANRVNFQNEISLQKSSFTTKICEKVDAFLIKMLSKSILASMHFQKCFQKSILAL